MWKVFVGCIYDLDLGWMCFNLTVIGWLVLKHGADVNAKDKMQQTALHWAAVHGSIAAADVLLENGARVEAADINGYRVLFSLCHIFLNGYRVIVN